MIQSGKQLHMPLRFTTQILSHMRDRRYSPVDKHDLATIIGVEDEDIAAFDKAIIKMIDDGSIVKGHHHLLELPAYPDEIEGRIKIHPKGFAFLIPEMPFKDGDLFIPAGSTLNAVSGDRVRVEVRRSHRRHGGRRSQSVGTGSDKRRTSKSGARGSRGGDRGNREGKQQHSDRVGRVVEIIKRARTSFVGSLERTSNSWVVITDGSLLHHPILVRDVGAKNAQKGDKVVVEMLNFPEIDEWGNGVITSVLGKSGEPDVETQAVIIGYDLPGKYPEECNIQTRQIVELFSKIDTADLLKDRMDIRNTFTTTIDPPDARDFDDAISIRRLTHEECKTKDVKSGYELGIHIADVAHFIPIDSTLDLEARNRGNSVYLPRHVIPMLPELLSNGICSLQEGVDRLAKSVFITLDDRAEPIQTRYASTMICSNKRLTYLEAEALINDQPDAARTHAISETPYADEIVPSLKLMSELAGIIRKRRLRDGMIVLTLPDVELQFDSKGHVIGVEQEDDASTHGIIEMFMVEANEAVARLFDQLKIPILRRTHPDPSTYDVSELRQFCRVAGVNIPKNPTRYELQWILDATRGKSMQHAVHLAVLKSLTRAEYSPALIGHFALASSDYAHFTSPIRRYPDLLLHRILAAYLEQTDNGRKSPKGKGIDRLTKTLRKDDRYLDEDNLIQMGSHCSDTERNAEMAERSLRTFLVLQHIEEQHQGDEFEGTVVSISANAFWVQLDQLLAEGMVQVKDLPTPNEGSKKKSRKTSSPQRGKYGGKKQKLNKHHHSDRYGNNRPDRWRLNRETGALVAQNSGKTIQIGDRLRIQVVTVDPPARRLDLRVIDFLKGKK